MLFLKSQNHITKNVLYIKPTTVYLLNVYEIQCRNGSKLFVFSDNISSTYQSISSKIATSQYT